MFRLSSLLLLAVLALVFARDKGIAVTGDNISGQLGLSDTNDRNLPVMVDNSAWYPEEPEMVCGGYGHTVVLTNKGSVYVMGENVYGQLGLGDNYSRYAPTLISQDSFDGNKIKTIACGDDHTILIDSKEQVWGFGKNDNYELGQGEGNKAHANKPITISFPSIMSGKPERAFAYGYTTYILTTKGQVWAFGMDDYGQTGCGSAAQTVIMTPTTLDMSQLPDTIPNTSKIVDLAPGGKHCLAIMDT
ncbi:hypothetical protein KIPB_010694, partial [Kipferlia bialata]|eukprot:g10694.t1